MKNSVLKHVILIQLAFASLPIVANAAIVDITVGQTAAGGSASTCGSPSTTSTSRTYDVRDGPGVTLPDEFIDVPRFARSVVYSQRGTECEAFTAGFGLEGVIGLLGSVKDSFAAPSQITGFSSIQETDIRIIPKIGRTYLDLAQQHGANIDVSPNIGVTGSVTTNSNNSRATLRADAAISGETSTGVLMEEADFAEISTQAANLTSNIGTTKFGVPFGTPGSATFSRFFERIDNERSVITIDPTKPISIDFSLTGFARAGRFDGNSEGQASFSSFNSLSFDPNGPAFFLPDGFTVNAPSLNIFDNRWIDPRLSTVGPSPSTVPLPASGLMLIGALGGLIAKRRARKKVT